MSDRRMLYLVSSRTPWHHEPDYWSESYDDLHLIATRQEPGRHWRGYIGAPVDDHVDGTALHVHGGELLVSYLPHAGGRRGYIYFGFDCAQYDGALTPDGRSDFSPKDYQEQRKARVDAGVYRTLEYVQAHCRQVADQLNIQRRWTTRLWRWFRAKLAWRASSVKAS